MKKIVKICERCRQAGLAVLTKQRDNEPYYICKDIDMCERRQRIAEHDKCQICSEWYCPQPATYQCSCGMLLCGYHSRLATHFGHKKERLDG